MAIQNFDDVFEEVGGIGVYQICIIVLFGGVMLLKADVIFMNFVGFEPDHWCKVTELVEFPHNMQVSIATNFTTFNMYEINKVNERV